VTEQFHKEKFFIKQQHLWYITPLFLVLVLIEVSDLIFAMDSIPAIFAITNDPFIVFTSNIFAILGLRALYFLLADMVIRFHLLKYGIALVLVFIGAKMLFAPWVVIPILLALSVVVATLATTVILSILNRTRDKI
jgi:tellurite resistance protein TerC